MRKATPKDEYKVHKNQQPSRLRQAIRWLDSRLQIGKSLAAGVAIREAKSAGISQTYLCLARWRLGIETYKSRKFNGSWVWERTICET